MLSVVQNRALGTVIVGLTQVFFTGIAALIMDRAGRKVLLCISGTVYYSRYIVLPYYTRYRVLPYYPRYRVLLSIPGI